LADDQLPVKVESVPGRKIRDAKYPWLEVLLLSTRIGGVLAAIGLALTGIVNILMGIGNAMGSSKSGAGMALVFTGIGLIFGGLAEFIWAFGITEFVRVVMNIEAAVTNRR
jgi:hypothetical protein